MVEPEKPFACSMPECGMTFTNEDHLQLHTKKHDMVLQFGCEQKAAFVADQTPTPTRFIRNCEEVGLFQDLQNVNPFDEGFKRAMETKQDILSLESELPTAPEELHTPQMFPLLDPTDSVYTTRGKNITISRSSSDENGVKELTTTISKLTNEVTTISRIVEKQDEAKVKDSMKNSVSYTNNVIKIHSNVEIRKDEMTDRQIEDTVIKDLPKEVYDRLQLEVPPIMSQKSIDFVVDSFTSDFEVKNDSKTKTVKEDTRCNKEDCKSIENNKNLRDYEVLLESILKLPSGHQVKIINTDDKNPVKVKNAKELLKKVITEKVEQKPQIAVPNAIIPSCLVPKIIPSGTLIPVSIVNTSLVPKLPLKVVKKPIKRKIEVDIKKEMRNDLIREKKLQNELDSRTAASRRYRARMKDKMSKQAHENKLLKEANDKLVAEKAALQSVIIEHMKRCHNADDSRKLQANISRIEDLKLHSKI